MSSKTRSVHATFVSLALVLAVTLSMLPALPARAAATLTVTTSSDSGPGSLRAQIASASAGDTIAFAPNVTGTIKLTGGQLTIDKTLTIQGPTGYELTISGNHTNRIFQVKAGASLTLSDLTLADGYAQSAVPCTLASSMVCGGAIHNAIGATLSLDRVTLRDSSAFVDGGALYNLGTATINRSTIRNNHALSGDGGGVGNHGTLTVTGSTFNDNVASTAGGALKNVLGTATLTNVTLSKNASLQGGGLFNVAGVVKLTHATVAFNEADSQVSSSGGGIFTAHLSSRTSLLVGATTIVNSIMASNTPGNCSGYAPANESTHNLQYGDDSCGSAFVRPNESPVESGLKDNGGLTQTHALKSSAWAAFDQGDLGACAPLDQRGVPRYLTTNDPCDIGAFEHIAVERHENPRSPIIFPIETQVIAESGATGPIPFRIFDPDTPASSLTVTATSADPTLVLSDAIVLGGSGTYRTVAITPIVGAHGDVPINLNVSDGDRTTAGGLLLTITSVNSQPIVTTNTGLVVAEGGAGTVSASVLEITDDDPPSQLTYTVAAAPAHGTLAKAGRPLAVGATFTQADLIANVVAYTHDGSETTADSFAFTASDGAGGTIPRTSVAITVTPVNDPPTLPVNVGLSVQSAGSATIDPTKLRAADIDNAPGQLRFALTAAPQSGQLKLGGTSLGAGATFTQADVDAGRVSYLHGGSTAPADAFTFTVSDGQASLPAATFSITITSGAAPSTPTPTPPTAGPVGGTVTPVTTPVRGPCAPRPNITISSVREAPGVLRVTLTAESSAETANNRLRELQVGAPSNAQVDVRDAIDANGQVTGLNRTGLTAATSIPLPPSTRSVTLIVRRAQAGPAVTVPLTLVDACGPWQTLVGGGPTAF